MDTLERKMKLKRLESADKELTRIKNDLIRKKREFEKFDALPESKKRRLTDQGLNPHEPKEIRDRKQARVKAETNRLIASLPKEERDKLHALGVDCMDNNMVIRRTTGTLTCKF